VSTQALAMQRIRFSVDEANHAGKEWRFNCGPGAICAVLNMTPAELRPRMLTFEAKGYTNPKLMKDVLRNLDVSWAEVFRSEERSKRVIWPAVGLVRVQWAGPWTNPGVPLTVRQRHTHWIGVRPGALPREVFDINATCVGGWVFWEEWTGQLVPWLLKQVEPKATGEWWPTHCIEVARGIKVEG